MQWLVFGGVGLVLLGLVIFAVVRGAKKDWRAQAKSLGLAPRGGAMTDLREGLTLSIQSREAGNTRVHSLLAFRIDFPTRLGLGLSAMGRPSDQRSLRTLTTGDDSFDDLVAVESREEARVLAYLTPERRACLKELIETDPRATLSDAGIAWNRNETVIRTEEFKRLTDWLVVAGQTLYSG